MEESVPFLLYLNILAQHQQAYETHILLCYEGPPTIALRPVFKCRPIGLLKFPAL